MYIAYLKQKSHLKHGTPLRGLRSTQLKSMNKRRKDYIRKRAVGCTVSAKVSQDAFLASKLRHVIDIFKLNVSLFLSLFCFFFFFNFHINFSVTA